MTLKSVYDPSKELESVSLSAFITRGRGGHIIFRGNGGEINRLQQSTKGHYIKKSVFRLTANHGGRVGSYEYYRASWGN